MAKFVFVVLLVGGVYLLFTKDGRDGNYLLLLLEREVYQNTAQQRQIRSEGKIHLLKVFVKLNNG